ncbi:MAG: AbrB family transcriptional regulator [Chloroflexi bacterium]|nr:MAG: AbrB family transcriptional regulator [Chloroflexota bacterium]
MDNKENNECYCVPTDKGCCKVEALVSVDDRGQMVLPKDIREKANIRAGDKLAVTCWERNGKVCCISLTKAEDLTEMVKGMLGPIMKDVLQS